jgi:eukaryotic-like serine/threonine-protein kinase
VSELDDQPSSQPVLPSVHHSLPAHPARVARVRGAQKGDVIGGRYIVDGQIGRGGMGRVLRVRHSALGKAFALKLPKAAISTNAEFRERFHREAKLASSLSHDNICSVVDFGEDEAHGLFMVMELLEGVRLDYKLRHDGRLAPRVAYDVMSQIAEALRYVHSKGIVHGDIKSENILLLRSERRRVAKLLDFGLARLSEAEHPGGIEGTPQYLAHERIEGRPASMASDIYALGILFYELLTGSLPFDGTFEEVFRKHMLVDVPAPSSKVERPLDERANLIVARATAKRPEDRHPDVASFIYELRALVAMEGLDGGRRPGGGPRRANRRTEGDDTSAQEVFLHAPLPLAAVDVHGRVKIANRAFFEFVASAGDEIMLGDTGLAALCPTLIDDLRLVAAEREPIKRAIRLKDSEGRAVHAAIQMTPAPSGELATAGQVYLAVHPLGRNI